MARAGSLAVEQIGRLLRAPDGITASIGRISQAARMEIPAITGASIFEKNISPDIAEKIAGARYPAIYVFCERISNKQIEKFRTFSGTADLGIEIRVSADHADSLQAMLHHYTDAITDVLDRNRGSWGQGMFYTGGYEATLGPIKRGGKCYLQIATVRTQITISLD